MTKLETKLKSLGFNRYKEQNGSIYYEKEILTFELNIDCNKIKKIHTICSEGYSVFRLSDLFATFANDLKEVSQYVS